MRIMQGIIKPDVPGKPLVKTDESGNITSYQNTQEVSVTTADTEIDTEFLCFDGKDWEMHIYAHFQASEQTSTYPTLLCCMQDSSPWPGITIRYEGTSFIIIFNDGAGTNHYYYQSPDDDGNVDIYITYKDNVANGTLNGTQFMTDVTMSSMDLSSLQLSLMADTGSAKRYGIGTIYEFYIRKL